MVSPQLKVACPLTLALIRDHVKELNSARPKQPFFFFKPPTCILQPGEGPVIRPKGVDLHYEIELALIMGKKVKDLAPDDEQGALDAIESESTCHLESNHPLPQAPHLPHPSSSLADQDQQATPCQST